MVAAEPNLPLGVVIPEMALGLLHMQVQEQLQFQSAGVLLPDLAVGLLQVHVLPARLVDPYMALDLLQDQVQVLSAFVDTT